MMFEDFHVVWVHEQSEDAPFRFDSRMKADVFAAEIATNLRRVGQSGRIEIRRSNGKKLDSIALS